MTRHKHRGKKRPHKKQSTRPKKITASQVFKTFLQNPNGHFVPKTIAKKLGAGSPKERTEINSHLKQLYFEGKVIRSGHGGYVLNTKAQYENGTYQQLNKRKGKVLTESGIEVIIDSNFSKYAISGDQVSVFLFPEKKNKPERQGEVVEVLKRNKTQLVGMVETSQEFAFIVPDNKKTNFDVFVRNKNMGAAKRGDKVIVDITEWPDKEGKNPEGKVVEVLGRAGEHGTEMHAIIEEFGLPTSFNNDVKAEANKISDKIEKSEIEKRRDLRDVLTFTIDPEDAKDFDDALSYQKLKNGNTEVGIHIADVTHYVLPQSKLEEEAFGRATSVYLVDRVIPMLPERLSNELCSLRPNEDKLTFSAIFEFDEKNKIVSQWFGRTIIHSDRRFSYEEAQTILDIEEGQFVDELLHLNQIAKHLRAERFKNGSIAFESLEVKFRLDANDKPTAVFTKERKETHKLIEDFMLLANKKVAEFVFFYKGGKEKNTMVYRTHDHPDMDKLGQFSSFAKRFGHNIKFSDKNIASELNRLSEEIEGTPESKVLQDLAIRSMAKAVYTTEPLEHFGLAFPHYTHFTSPIRRYPDMMVHRLLQHYLDDGKKLSPHEWEERCKHSSGREVNAAQAERASIKFKQVEFMQDLVGDEFDGFVSGVTEWGIFVEIPETNCEGLVRLSDISDEYYHYDEKTLSVVGRRSKNRISFGDAVRVMVKQTNIFERTIDLLLVD